MMKIKCLSIVYVHCREDGCIGLYIPDDQEISRGPRDVPRAEGNLEVGGDVQPNSSRFEAVYGHSLIINPSLGMYQEIHPCRASSTYSVKINTSLPMMRECTLPSRHAQSAQQKCVSSFLLVVYTLSKGVPRIPPFFSCSLFLDLLLWL